MCSLGFSIQKSVDDSNLYYFKDKGSIEITSKLEASGRALLSGAIGWILTKFEYFTEHLKSLCGAERKLVKKKITEASFSNLVSNLLYTYLKKSTEKLWAKSILWAKLDMRILQTGSQLKFHVPSNLSRTVSYWEYVNESNSQVLLL